jgi:hypothetical protein
VTRLRGDGENAPDVPRGRRQWSSRPFDQACGKIVKGLMIAAWTLIRGKDLAQLTTCRGHSVRRLASRTMYKATLRCVCNGIVRIGNDFEADKDQSSQHSTHGELSASKPPNKVVAPPLRIEGDKVEDDTNLSGTTPADQALSQRSCSLRAASHIRRHSPP